MGSCQKLDLIHRSRSTRLKTPPRHRHRSTRPSRASSDRRKPEHVTWLLPLIGAIPLIRGKRDQPLSKPALVQSGRLRSRKYRRPLHAASIPTQIARRGQPHRSGLGPDGSSSAGLLVRFECLALIHEALMKIAYCITCWRQPRYFLGIFTHSRRIFHSLSMRIIQI